MNHNDVSKMTPEEIIEFITAVKPYMEGLESGEPYMMEALEKVADEIVSLAPEPSKPTIIELTELHPVYRDEADLLEDSIAIFLKNEKASDSASCKRGRIRLL